MNWPGMRGLHHCSGSSSCLRMTEGTLGPNNGMSFSSGETAVVSHTVPATLLSGGVQVLGDPPGWPRSRRDVAEGAARGHLPRSNAPEEVLSSLRALLDRTQRRDKNGLGEGPGRSGGTLEEEWVPYFLQLPRQSARRRDTRRSVIRSLDERDLQSTVVRSQTAAPVLHAVDEIALGGTKRWLSYVL
jgi:hypothetical protein